MAFNELKIFSNKIKELREYQPELPPIIDENIEIDNDNIYYSLQNIHPHIYDLKERKTENIQNKNSIISRIINNKCKNSNNSAIKLVSKNNKTYNNISLLEYNSESVKKSNENNSKKHSNDSSTISLKHKFNTSKKKIKPNSLKKGEIKDIFLNTKQKNIDRNSIMNITEKYTKYNTKIDYIDNSYYNSNNKFQIETNNTYTNERNFHNEKKIKKSSSTLNYVKTRNDINKYFNESHKKNKMNATKNEDNTTNNSLINNVSHNLYFKSKEYLDNNNFSNNNNSIKSNYLLQDCNYKSFLQALKSKGFNIGNDFFNINNPEKTNYNNKTNKKTKSIKMPLVHLKISQLRKITYKNGLYNLLTFLDYDDLINILSSSKLIKVLINESIIEKYFLPIKNNLYKYNNFLEVLNFSLIYTRIKETLKIDFKINIKFIDKDNLIKINKPKHFQLLYLYKYNNDINNNKLFDCYSYDLYNDNENYQKINDNNSININNRTVFISKELISFKKDENEKIINVQPILPFRIDDKGIFNFEIFNCKNNFIKSNTIKIILKTFDLNDYISKLKSKKIRNWRFCEHEYVCEHWLDMERQKIKLNQYNEILKNIFEKFFVIKNIFCENIGIMIYKFHLIAKKKGIIDNDELDIKLIIKDENDYIENEIKKNHLLFEIRKVFELRKGDSILFYLATKN